MMNRRGQAMTEMVFIIPLLLALAAGVCAVVFMCWQGIKVQQAANLAARIQGQERVAGGIDFASIQNDNGVLLNNKDRDPTLPTDKNGMDALRRPSPRRWSPNTVYGKIQIAVRAMFGASAQDLLFVPPPQYGLVGYSDQVKVVRLWQPPEVFGLTVPPVKLEATAYGGEDSNMYGLRRWGSATRFSTQKFWSQKDPGTQRPENLPNPHND